MAAPRAPAKHDHANWEYGAPLGISEVYLSFVYLFLITFGIVLIIWIILDRLVEINFSTLGGRLVFLVLALGLTFAFLIHGGWSLGHLGVSCLPFRLRVVFS